MRKVSIVAFKKRDIFLILIILFMIAVGVFGGSVDSESPSSGIETRSK